MSRIRRLRWWLRVSLVILALGATVAAAIYCYQHWQIEQQYQVVIADLDKSDPGWRWQDIQKRRATIPDKENGALVVLRASAAMPLTWPSAKFDEPVDFFAQIREIPPPYQMTDEQFRALKAEIKDAEPALRIARKLADYPKGLFPIAYKKIARFSIYSGLYDVAPVEILLEMDIRAACQQGDLVAGWRSCWALLNFASAVGDEPSQTAQVYRNARRIRAICNMERVLSHGQVPVELLKSMQLRLEKEESEKLHLIALRGERAMGHNFFRALETGDLSFATYQTMVFGAGAGTGWINGTRNNLRGMEVLKSEHLQMLRTYNNEITLSTRPEAEQVSKIPRPGFHYFCISCYPHQQIETLLKTSSPQFGATLYLTLSGKTRIRCAITALACERHRVKFNSFPDSLDELKRKGFIKQLFTDPFNDGKPLTYRKTEKGVVVFSTFDGAGHQYGGEALDDPDLEEPYSRIEYRLWNPDQRNRPPHVPRNNGEKHRK